MWPAWRVEMQWRGNGGRAVLSMSELKGRRVTGLKSSHSVAMMRKYHYLATFCGESMCNPHSMYVARAGQRSANST